VPAILRIRLGSQPSSRRCPWRVLGTTWVCCWRPAASTPLTARVSLWLSIPTNTALPSPGLRGQAERRATMGRASKLLSSDPTRPQQPAGRSLGKPHQRRAGQYRATHEPSTHPHLTRTPNKPTRMDQCSPGTTSHQPSRPPLTPAGARTPPRAPRLPSLQVLTGWQLRPSLPWQARATPLGSLPLDPLHVG
jgi:hypothetical protein